MKARNLLMEGTPLSDLLSSHIFNFAPFKEYEENYNKTQDDDRTTTTTHQRYTHQYQ